VWVTRTPIWTRRETRLEFAFTAPNSREDIAESLQRTQKDLAGRDRIAKVGKVGKVKVASKGILGVFCTD